MFPFMFDESTRYSLWKCWSEVNKCTEAGGIFKFYVADWFALMNDKMGGDMKKIKVGDFHISIRFYPFIRIHHLSLILIPFLFQMPRSKDTGMYFVHVWKSCGMKMENVRFIWASDFIEENATEFLDAASIPQSKNVNENTKKTHGNNMKQQRETVRCLKT